MASKVKVLRAFLIKGEVQAVSSLIEVSDNFALELIHMGKVERVDATPAKRGPMTTKSAGQLVDGATKGKQDD
jgi:hypothetical protein